MVRIMVSFEISEKAAQEICAVENMRLFDILKMHFTPVIAEEIGAKAETIRITASKIGEYYINAQKVA